jgi:hypothetical protein
LEDAVHTSGSTNTGTKSLFFTALTAKTIRPHHLTFGIYTKKIVKKLCFMPYAVFQNTRYNWEIIEDFSKCLILEIPYHGRSSKPTGTRKAGAG